MYCQNCGKKLEEGAKFCASCGSKCSSPNEGMLEKAKKLDKRILIGAGVIVVLILFIAMGGFGQKYTKNMQRVREGGNPMYLGFRTDGSNYEIGELLDVALKKSKWTERNNQVIVTGKDVKTGENIKIVFEVEDNDIDFIEIVNGEEESDEVSAFYYWLNDYVKYLK